MLTTAHLEAVRHAPPVDAQALHLLLAVPNLDADGAGIELLQPHRVVRIQVRGRRPARGDTHPAEDR